MVDLVMMLSVIGGIAAVMLALVLVATRVRRRGTAGPAISAAMAAYDEAMHSSAHDTFVEVQAQRDRKSAISAPADPERTP